ncbi:type II toxin-antitoxin system HigB family toxin [Methylobacterium sp. Leaf100]|uniref:type II toxin-antitoxin system HigB family toxin n=1 Tax=Methylobacterium sp. Leaf100 TaxID=1736252 RepID=UPI0009E94262|nr:type II toxin-antitoxin system HigB family toxin [Methylobacterium sp. Leaf100]
MNVVAIGTLRDFWTVHPQSEGPLVAWHTIVTKAQWSVPQDVKNTFGSVDFIGDNRAIFDIGGNNYRLICHISYTYKAVQIKFVGTHAEYDKVDALTVGNPKEKQKRRT